MPGQIPIRTIVCKTLDGIAQAQKDYETWTDGDWVWNAPEYMLCTYIAQKLSKIQGAKYVTLENSTKTALDNAGAIGRGKLNSKLRIKGRFDVLLWWGSYYPRAAIEVKNQITSIEYIKDDLHRVAQVLKRKNMESSFQFGLIAYYSSCRDNNEYLAKERISKRIENIYKDAKTILGEKYKVSSYNRRIKSDEDSAWVAAALVIQYRTAD